MILWVDDDIFLLRPFIDELQDKGYKVIKATSGDEMQNILSKKGSEIDLIIMDLILPIGTSLTAEETNFGRVTGLKFIEIIKKDKKLCNVPVILFTVVSDIEIQEWCSLNNIKLLRKAQTLPTDFLIHVQSLILDSQNDKT